MSPEGRAGKGAVDTPLQGEGLPLLSELYGYWGWATWNVSVARAAKISCTVAAVLFFGECNHVAVPRGREELWLSLIYGAVLELQGNRMILAESSKMTDLTRVGK